MGRRNPIRLLKSLFPWPVEKPDVPELHERWFNDKKKELLREVVPKDAKLVVELGSWLGDSTCWFCEWCPNATVVAVDTWLGSTEHIMRKRAVLPVLFETFLANCWEHRDRLVPFRNTTLGALNFLKRIGIVPDAIYFDSDHSFWGLLSELETARNCFPDALYLGDDFTGVRDSLESFRRHGAQIKHINQTWYIQQVAL